MNLPRAILIIVLMAFLPVACRLSGPAEVIQGSRPRTDRLKVLVAASGLYELNAAQLKAAGLEFDSTVRLFYRGREQPVWIEGEGESLVVRFYGQAGQSRYARENVYWLQADSTPGPPMPMVEPGTPMAGPAVEYYWARTRVEENLIYTPQVETGDHWLWVSLAAPRTQTVTVPLTALASGEGQVTLEVWSNTQAAQSPDHHLRVALNGRPVADEKWDGPGRHTFTATVPGGVWVEGANVLQVEAPGDLGLAAEVIALDWVEITYPRRFVAEGDRLEFTSAGGVHVVSGLSGPAMVLDISDVEHVVRVGEVHSAGGAIFGEAGHRYLVVGPKGKYSPTRLVPAWLTPDLRAPGSGADYVAIGPADLLAPLQPLLEWRASQGLKVEAIPVEAVYDQFNAGLPEPEAIRAWVRYALQNWQPAPQYLVLVGDATYDPLGYVAAPEANRLPTFLVFTVHGGETASDVAFVQLDETLLPQLAVGRIPAATAGQVRTLVEKTLAYEQRAPAGEWRRRVLAVADGQSAEFRQDAQAFLDGLPAGYQGVLYQPPAGARDASQQVRQYLEAGYLLVGYFGHGSITQWGKDRIWTVEERATPADEAQLSVMVNMTCLTGLFTHPKMTSLAETLLWQPGGGAVAVLAPTSLTLASDQGVLSHALAQALWADSSLTLGQALWQAQRQLRPEQAGQRDVLQTFLLFGDPALRPAFPN